MGLESLHLLLTYRCDRECDHCFVWGSPNAKDTMTIKTIKEILRQAKETGSIKTIYFEGGEPFLFFPVLVEGVRRARREGFEVGIVTNGYWGISVEDAKLWLRELKALGIHELTISRDTLHENDDRTASIAAKAARDMGMPASLLETCLAEGEKKGDVMFKGRAAKELAKKFRKLNWADLNECPERLLSPERVHIDPLGWVHVCQGLAIGNIFKKNITEIFASYDPRSDPIICPLIDGGPAQLIRAFRLAHRSRYADACELCYEAREKLRKRYPSKLAPDQMYGILD